MLKQELVGVINFGYDEERDETSLQLNADSWLLDWETEPGTNRGWIWSPFDPGFALLFKLVEVKS
jgi:hypothetical protein